MTSVSTFQPGYELPTFVREGTLQHWNRFAAVNNEFAGHHMADDVARSEGFDSAFIMAPLEQAYIHALLRNAIGESGRIVFVNIKFRKPLGRGRTLTAGAVVSSVEHGENEVIIDLEVWEDDNEGARLVKGSARVAFPA